MGMLDRILEEAELEYERHPRLVLAGFIAMVYVLAAIQSWIAQPRSITAVFLDTWEMLAIIAAVIWVIWRPTQRKLLACGLLSLILGIARAFLGFPAWVKVEYSTLLSLVGIWLLGEWYNYRRYKHTLLTDLLSGNYYLAAGLFISTVILGVIVEFLNAPAGLWWYRWPFPSVEIFGIPVILAAFGWVPWILAMFVFFYPFTFRKPRKGLKRK